MSNEFNWEDFLQGKTIINCQSSNDCRCFLKECSDRGLRWMTGIKITDFDYYEDYGEETCFHYRKDEGLSYSSIGYFLRQYGSTNVVLWN